MSVHFSAQDRLQPGKTAPADDRTRENGGHKGADSVALGRVVVLFAELAADEAACAHAESVADGLQNGHERVDHADCSRC